MHGENKIHYLNLETTSEHDGDFEIESLFKTLSQFNTTVNWTW